MLRMTNRKGFLAQQNTFLDTIATRFDGTHSNFVLGNAQASGCPIVYCSDGFCELTGYARAQVMGKSCACKFLYGQKTVDSEKSKIDDALDNIEELKTEILLYRRNGVAFWCLMDIIPIKNEKSQVVLFLVSHKDISRERSASSDVPEKESSEESDGDEDYDENFRPPIPRCRAEMPTNCNYQRRRSRAVLYHLSGQFERQNRAKSKLQKFNKLTESISGKMPEYKVQEVKKSRYVIAHYGLFKIGWDWLIMLCTFYTAIMVPFNAAFITMDGNNRTSIYSDVVVEVLFIIDIVLNFRTSFVSKSGQIVYDGRLIAVNYIRGWFLLDLLAAIPFDFLYTLDISTNTPVHLLKVARLLRLARLLQKIDRYSQYSAIVLALLMLLFALSAHWLACIWYAIGYHELDKNPPNWTTGWLYELSERLDRPINKTNKLPLLTSYITALYFTCSSLTSVGFGNVSANTDTEKIFSVCAMLVGAMMHAVVFGNVTAIIQRMYSRRANYHSRTKDLKDFFRTHRIPKPLKHRMQEYFQTMWSMNNGMETGEILKDFPDEMRGEICMHLHKDLLSLAIFENATQGCLKSISLQTRRAFSAPGEFLVHKGDTINYVYLLCSGTMEVLKQEMVVAILGKGDLFGADVNLEDPVGISCCDVRSLTYCELQGINIKGLCDVLTFYPDFAEKFAQDIRHDLTYNLKEGYEESDDDYEEKPIGRVITLPSISEDDEESDSDRDPVFSKGDNCSSPGSHRDRESSPSSPLLSEKTFSYNLPNGDIDGLSKFDRDVTSPPSRRAVTPSKRSISTAFRRSSLRERKRNISNKCDLDRVTGMENLSVSLQNLKLEFEGTKTNIHQIERKVDHIGSELTNMDEKLKSLLEILTPNPSVHSLSPPNTPFSPYTKPHFSFGSPTSEEDVLGSARPASSVVSSSLEVPYSTRRKSSFRDKESACLKPTSAHAACKDSILKHRTNKSCDDIFQSGNNHQDLERRHSDDVPYRKCTHEQNGSAYKKPDGPVMFEYLSDIDKLRIHPTETDENKKYDIPIDKTSQSVHTISTGDCRKPATMISRIPRSVIVQTQHAPNSKNILETTDL